MKNYFNVDQESAQTSSELVITSSNFFITEDNKNGYFRIPEFSDYADKMPILARPQFAGVMDEMKKGTKMDGSIVVRRDRGNMQYAYLKFFYARGIKGYKVIYNDGIRRLIDDYFSGKIRIEVSANELYQASMND